MDKLSFARNNVKKLKDECGGYKQLWARLNKDKEVNRRDTQTFTNLVNRGAYKAELIIQLMEEFGLEDVTLGEFFKGEIPRKPKD
ncbi:hypothetical protein KIH87_13535 [Paraneptunicella aestuarii]|uniref:hypothetical protein n=1 Tax=Paraneptunicella aestuarii TaxID=2831148 RepID=UPI001E641F3E|nr:hypothetical protein [Paraneptunicella aestuarii]UAA37725.1 hypothetical protein KIH87_13535 [Paraneptunicella aestuarii]